eukprot:TRINITY_DN549_c2_g1_i4.p1 TRINITY_DN549_c2_g1~~TRINITY_DN549_c2_g1_i4.p1  ORF type:complete len:235 (+),score=58.93 TRINITY_DN549_c2_g1_i4:70-774(+)
MNTAESNRQIEHLCKFILQEAQEKSNELRLKTEQDYHVSVQSEIQSAKQKINDEFSRKEKSLSVEKKIAHSRVEIGERNRLFKARAEMIEELLEHAKERLARISEDKKGYSELLQRLIVQAAVKIEQPKVEVLTREIDVELTEKVLPAAREDYIRIFKEETGDDVDIELSVNKNPRKFLNPPPSGSSGLSCAGGIVLSARSGTIQCSNTLDERLKLVFEDLKPTFREILFPAAL